MRVLIVEDNPQLREFLRVYVRDFFSEIAECADADGAFELYRELRPDVVLMDIALGGGSNGIAATRRIVGFDPRAKVVMVTSFDEKDLRQAAADAGATGYVLKRDLSGLDMIFGLL